MSQKSANTKLIWISKKNTWWNIQTFSYSCTSMSIHMYILLVVMDVFSSLLSQPIAVQQRKSLTGLCPVTVGHPDIWNGGRLIKAGHNCPPAIVAIFWVIFTQADVSVVIYEGWEEGGGGISLLQREKERHFSTKERKSMFSVSSKGHLAFKAIYIHNSYFIFLWWHSSCLVLNAEH